MFTLTPLRILGVLALYAALFAIIRFNKRGLSHSDKRLFITIALGWAVLVFSGNYAFYKIGIMSFLPWINNFMHCFLWIGTCLTYLYLSVRDSQPLVLQCLAFATFSLIVKYAEQLLLGTWEHGHFFFIFQGNFAYVLGWSLLDGLYPLITLAGLRLLSRFKLAPSV